MFNILEFLGDRGNAGKLVRDVRAVHLVGASRL